MLAEGDGTTPCGVLCDVNECLEANARRREAIHVDHRGAEEDVPVLGGHQLSLMIPSKNPVVDRNRAFGEVHAQVV